MKKLGIAGLAVLLSVFFWGCSSEPREKKWLLKGNAALEEGNVDMAIKCYNEAIEENNTYADAFNNRGVAFFEKGNYSLALNDYNTSLLLQDSFPDARWNRARLLYTIKQYDNAREDLTYLKDNEAYALETHFLNGLIAVDRQRFKASLVHFDSALALQPNHYEALVNKANVLYYRGEYKQSLDLLAGFKKFTDPEALNVKALNFIELANYDSARHYLDMLVEKFPRNAAFINNRALLEIKSNNLDRAKADLDKSFALDEDNAWWWRNNALWMGSSGNMAEYENTLEKTYAYNEYVKGLESMIGKWLLQNEMADSACFHFRKARDLNETQGAQLYAKYCITD